MDTFYLKIFGDTLDVEKVRQALSNLSTKAIYLNGDDFGLINGEKVRNRRGLPYRTSSIELDGGENTLADLLRFTESRKDELRRANTQELEVWAVLERSAQINGELAPDELKLLCSLGARFCWSIVQE
jgi:hypothetical protein